MARPISSGSGISDTNIAFDDICSLPKKLVKKLEFSVRVKGSHHIFTKKEVVEILNIQSKQGKAKAYQVKQVRELILKYNLAEGIL